MATTISMPRWPQDLQSQLRSMDNFFTEVASVISGLEEEIASLKEAIEQRDYKISELAIDLAEAQDRAKPI